MNKSYMGPKTQIEPKQLDVYDKVWHELRPGDLFLKRSLGGPFLVIGRSTDDFKKSYVLLMVDVRQRIRAFEYDGSEMILEIKPQRIRDIHF